MTSTAITKGSLADIARLNNQSISESFLNADAICLFDVSYSMTATDAPGGRSRYEVACLELAKVQASLPGKVAVIAFSTEAHFVPGGVPPFYGASTGMADALRFVQPADGTVKFVLISDGEPDSAEDTMAVAGKFSSKIDTVYVGPESDTTGRQFLLQLSAASGGIYSESLKTANLGANLTLLIKAGG